MRFKTDENLHPEVAAFLRDLGHDALTVWDQGLRGKSDSGIAEACRLEKRAEAGFANIRSYPPQDFAGSIVLRLKWQSRKHVLSVVPRFLSLLRTEPLTGQLWIVDEQRVRVRQG